MAKTTGQRKKSWHESKHLRKRAAFLLENLDLIPTDVCFRITTEEEQTEEVHGHKIFFALASPVFHAMFYGPMKGEGDVEIEDISAGAFRCLQKYIYTDSIDTVSLANVVDVLAAAKKYMMAKLTRHCYGFIQNNITAKNSVSLWSQARNISDETVAEQCVAEIKRNTTKAVLTEGFLNMSQDQLLELTSWQTLTINEFNLFQAVKKWKLFQEGTTGFLVSCRLEEGGIFQNIRFALFALEQLADKFILDEVFSPDDLKEIFCHKTAAMELTTFSPKIRDPALPSFQLSIKYFGIDADGDLEMFGSLEVLIWADVAPKACQILRRYVENHFRFAVEHTVGRSTDANRGLARCTGRTTIDGWGPVFQLRKLSQEEIAHVEKQSGLWEVPHSVLLIFGEKGPQLLISNRMEQPLIGQQPSINLTEDTTGEQSGIVIGKVLSSSPELVGKFQRKLNNGVSFHCSIVQTNV